MARSARLCFTWKKQIPPRLAQKPGGAFHFGKKRKDLRLSAAATDAFELPGIFTAASYLYKTGNNHAAIEVDIYKPLQKKQAVYLGMDIGSTSTKAVLINSRNEVLIGLYTQTAGQPVTAVQALFGAIDNISQKHSCEFIFDGVGATGSGRKFIGRIINADLIIDESPRTRAPLMNSITKRTRSSRSVVKTPNSPPCKMAWSPPPS